MTDRFLKHIPSGQIFIYQAPFATQADFVEVADAQGTPFPDAIDAEFSTVVDDGPVTVTKKSKKKAGVAVDDLDDLDAALSADASRGA